MSIKALNWAWEQRLEPSTKLVLLALADIADDAGRCWPSVATLAKKVHASERNVRRILQKLRSDNGQQALLRAEERRREDGSQSSNIYVLQLQTDNLSACEISQKQDDITGKGGLTEPRQGAGAAGDIPGADIAASGQEPPVEPPPEPKRRTTSGRAVDKQLSAETQRLLVRELSRLDAGMQSELMSQLAEGLRTGSIRSPAGWMKAAVDRITKSRSA